MLLGDEDEAIRVRPVGSFKTDRLLFFDRTEFNNDYLSVSALNLLPTSLAL